MGARRAGGTLWSAIEQAGENPNLSPRARTALGGFAALVRGFAKVAAEDPPSALFDDGLRG